MRFLIYLLFFSCIYVFSVEENFLLRNGSTDEVILEIGPHIQEPLTPACSFNIALSLMGYDSGILKDENEPQWDFQEGYDSFLETWKAAQTPLSWMKHSCVWYSRLLAAQLGAERIQNYLKAFEYGNQDMSGGLTQAWLSSSLKISPKEQVDFIQKMIQGKFPISARTFEATKKLLFKEESNGWKLYGKTGLGSLGSMQVAWFVGWFEKDNVFYPFAYNRRETQVIPGQSLFRVKELFNITQSGQIAKTNGIDIWYETFGEKKNPPILLVIGGLGQGILWPTEFCQQLADAKFYVIRYDHRDAGFSTCFNFERNPYNLLDMAKDAIGLLDHLGIEKTHVFGLSMGGPIAELMSVYFPGRISTLTLVATSPDFEPSMLAYEGFLTDATLSRPKEHYLEWMHQFLKSPPLSKEEQLKERVKAWEILNGSIVPFERDRYLEIQSEFLDRSRHPECLINHMPAIKNSYELIQEVPRQVKVPTLIIQGSEDPIFPPDHGEALHVAIGNSRYLLVDGLGHVLNQHFYPLIIQEIKKHASE